MQIKLAEKNVDNMEKRKRERNEQMKRNTVIEEGEEELNLQLRELPPEGEVCVTISTHPLKLNTVYSTQTLNSIQSIVHKH